MKPRSPIERMIDEACGYDPTKKPPKKEKITLRCPRCGKEKLVDRSTTDPPGTVVIETDCPPCGGGITYYDKDGNSIPL